MSRKYLIGTCVLFIAPLVLCPWILAVAPDRISHFVHREVVYADILHRVTNGLESPEDRAFALFRFVQLHTLIFPGQDIDRSSLSQAPLRYLLSQSGWCDQQNGVLIALVQRLGMNGSLLVLKDETGSPAHVVSLIDAGGAKTVLDTYYGLYFSETDGSLAPVDHIVGIGDNQTGFITPQHQGALLFGSNGIKEELDVVLSLIRAPKETTRQILDYNGVRKALSQIILLYHRFLGHILVRSVQALYFIVRSPSDYERARYMQLAGQYEGAIKEYNLLLSRPHPPGTELPSMIYSGNQPDHPGLYESVIRFSLAQTLWSKGSFSQAEKEFIDLTHLFPDSGWASAASYFLGDIYYRTGDLARAKVEWLKYVDSHSLPSLEQLYKTREIKNGPD